MELEESQLSYLYQRGKEYDRKYGMFKNLLEQTNDVNSVLELFGGIGIETEYIKKYIQPATHIVCEQNKKCCDFLSQRKVQVVNGDCFEYKNNNKIDLLVVDSVFNNKEYETIINLIKNFDFKYLLLTNTGVFHVRFDKTLSYEKYWESIIGKINNDLNTYHVKTLYNCDFGLMLFSKDDSQEDFGVIKNVLKDKMWREVREQSLLILQE